MAEYDEGEQDDMKIVEIYDNVRRQGRIVSDKNPNWSLDVNDYDEKNSEAA